MAKRNIKFNLELYNKDILPKFTIKQFDNALINIATYAGGNVFNPVGNTCKLYVSVGGEVFLQNNKISVLENAIEIDLDKNIISTGGKALGELELSDGNGILTSATFLFNIEPKIGEGATIPGEIEGFIAMHERLIREFKEEQQAQLNNISSNIDSLTDELNSHSSELSQIKSKNDEQDLRLKQIEYKNKVQDLYVKGLFNENKDGRLTIEGEGNSLKLEGSKEGLVTVDKVVGNTMVNIVSTYDLEKYILTNAQQIEDSYFKLQHGADVNKTKVVAKFGTHIYKPNTTYTVFVDIKENTCGKKLGLSAFNSPLMPINPPYRDFENLTGISSTLITTKTDINSDNIHDLYFGIWENGGDLSNHITFRYWIIEGDYTNKPIPNKYFEGMQSSFEEFKVTQEMIDNGEENVENLGKYKCDIEVRGKNLFDKSYPYSTYRFATTSGSVGSNVMVNNLSGSHKNIRLELPKGEYGIQINMLETYPDKWTFSILETDKDIMELNDELKVICSNQHFNNTLIKSKFTVSKKYQYVRISYNSSDTLEESVLSTIQIEEGAQATSYEPYYRTTKTIYLNSPLHKGDEIVYIDGELKHYHKVDKYVLNGTENWALYQGANEIQEYPVFYYDNPNVGLNHNFISDNIPVKTIVTASTGTFAIGSHSTNNGFRICIENSKLSSRTVAGFKAWLQANPATVVYELTEPYYEKISDDKLLLEIPNNATLSVESIIPCQSITATYTGSIPSVYNMENSIQAIEDHNVEIIATTFDMDYRLLEVEWTLEDAGLTGISLANTFNINKNIRGGNTMALSRYEQAKIMILGGAYDKATLTKQLTRYLEKNIITKEEYDDLMSLMEAKELVTGE